MSHEEDGGVDREFYNFDLDIQLETCVDLYEQSRRKYWEGEGAPIDLGRSAAFFKKAEELAEALVEATGVLASPRNMEPPSVREMGYLLNDALLMVAAVRQVVTFRMDEVRAARARGNDAVPKLFDEEIERLRASGGGELLRHYEIDDSLLSRARPPEDSVMKLVWERLCIKFGWEIAGGVAEKANRVLLLAQLIAKADPCPSAEAFLRRVSRCFIFGFHPECIIVCRGVLDSAFREAVPDTDSETHGLAKRIVVAHQTGKITEEVRNAAFKVKNRGDKAVHYDPHATDDVLGTILDTLVVLRALDAS